MELTSYWQLRVIAVYLKAVDQLTLECDHNNVKYAGSLLAWPHTVDCTGQGLGLSVLFPLH